MRPTAPGAGTSERGLEEPATAPGEASSVRPMKPERRMSDDDTMAGRAPAALFKNEETRLRRAWIERALAAVRRQLAEGEDPPAPAGTPAPATESVAGDTPVPRPRLYVVAGGKGS